VFSQLGAGSIPRLGEIQLDWRVLGFAFVLSLFTGVLFGILPAAASGKMSVNDRLKDNGARASSGTLGRRSRILLVGSEIALAAILLVGAGLLLRSILQLRRVDPGFDPNRVVTMRMSLNSQKYPDPEHIGLFYSNLMAKVQALPGVESAGLVSALPLSATNNSGMTTMETVSQGSNEPSTETDWIVATPGYFETMHIGLVEGRLFDARDAAQAPRVAIIDQAMARTYWPHESAVGKRIKLGRITSSHPWMTIIGVVREVHYATLQKIARMQLYWPENQDPARTMALTVRTPLASRAMADEISSSIHAMDPNLSLYSVRGMSEVVSDSLARLRFSLSLLMVFAGLATILAAVGIYGVVSYTVTQRTQEIGLRMALGANRVDTIAMIFGETIRIALAGIVIGLVVSLLLARLISSMLFGVPSYDFVTLGAVLALLMIVSCFAILGPALRASAIAPGVALAQN
jgi:predicted permease